MMPTDKVVAALRAHGKNPVRCGSGWSAKCPVHDDNKSSLSVSTGEDGRALVYCHVRCPQPDIVAAIGLTMQDLFPDGDGRPLETRPQSAGKVRKYPTPEAAIRSFRNQFAGSTVRTWEYLSADGAIARITVRLDLADGGKEVRRLSPRGGGWVLREMDGPLPLLGLPELDALSPGSRVYVTEGETARDAAIECGLAATTSAGGANGAAKSDWSSLAGMDVIVLPDHDSAGEGYAADVARLALAAGAQSVRVVRLAEAFLDLGAGEDLVDVLQLAGGDVEAVVAAIEGLVASAECVEPEQDDEDDSAEDYEPFPVELLPSPVRRFVVEGADAISCDRSLVALPLLSALAAAIGNSRVALLDSEWREPCVLWTAVACKSGSMKSPAFDLALKRTKDLQWETRRDFEEALEEHAAEEEIHQVDFATWKKRRRGGAAEDPPTPPRRPTWARTWTSDATIEAIIALLGENPRGLLIACDELRSWFSFGRYTNNAGGDAVQWIQLHGARDLTVDRKTSGTTAVRQAAASITGTIQPKILRRVFTEEHFDSGLAARFLFTMPPERRKQWTRRTLSADAKADLHAVIDALYSLEMRDAGDGLPEPVPVTLTREADKRWERFVNAHADETFELNAQGEDDLGSAWSKLEGAAARIALIVHLVRAAASDPDLEDEEQIDLASLEAGIGLSRWFASEAERVYRLFRGKAPSKAPQSTLSPDRLLAWIAERGGVATRSRLKRGPLAFRDEAALTGALDELVASGALRCEADPPGRKGGRPTKRFVVPASPATASATTTEASAESPADDSASEVSVPALLHQHSERGDSEAGVAG